MQLQTFQEAEVFLQTHIQKEPVQATRGEVWLARSKQFMQLLGNPQDQLKIIHIAGTSGKGSTALLTSTMLISQGFSVGLQMSPYVIDLRERIQLNNQMISKEEFVQYLNEIIPTIEKAEKTELGSPTYFEILVGLSYYIFAKKHVDYAVIETGLGGSFDATNVVSRPDKLCIITKLGLDHTKILGSHITDIARAKSGIIQRGNMVITTDQEPEALDIIKQTVIKQSGGLLLVRKHHEYNNISISPHGTTFDFSSHEFHLNKLTVSLIGEYQAENASLALQALRILSQRDHFVINQYKVREALKQVSFPARFDIRTVKGKTVVIDGAHNPQKMQEFTKSLQEVFPKQQFTFLVAFLATKDYAEILKAIIPLAGKIIITSFSMDYQDWSRISEDPYAIANELKRVGFSQFEVISDKDQALPSALQGSATLLVITGSLYFSGQIYSLLQQKSK